MIHSQEHAFQSNPFRFLDFCSAHQGQHLSRHSHDNVHALFDHYGQSTVRIPHQPMPDPVCPHPLQGDGQQVPYASRPFAGQEDQDAVTGGGEGGHPDPEEINGQFLVVPRKKTRLGWPVVPELSKVTTRWISF
jgi:hypothetical protein